MRVIFVSEFIETHPITIAFTKRVRSLASEISRSGCTVDVISPQGMELVAEGGSIKEFRIPRSETRRRLARNVLFRNIFWAVFAFSLLRRMRNKRPDSVIVSSHDPRASLLATLAARIAVRNVVFDVHDSWIILSRTHAGFTRNKIRMRIERLAFRFAVALTTVSPMLKGLMIEIYRIDGGKISVIYNAADPPRSMPQVSKDIDIIHLGSPRVYYDTSALLDALAILRESGQSPNVVFLGCRDDSCVAQAKDKARDLGLEGQVQFLPPVPHDEVGLWLSRARIAVYTIAPNPEYSSALGLKLFEYISYGLPVVHMGEADTEVSRFIATTGIGLTSTTAIGLAQALKSLLLDEEKREALSARARETSKEYSWEKSGQRMASILRTL